MAPADAKKIRKLLGIHPRREIPAKVVKKYQSLYHMLSHVQHGFGRETMALLCAMTCKVVRGTLNKEPVLMVDGEDLSTDPDAAEKAERAEAAKVAALARREVHEAAIAKKAAEALKDALAKSASVR